MSKITLLSQCLVERFDLPQAKADEFVERLFAIIRENLEYDGIVKVKGLGTFKLAEMNARESVDVNTGERITIEGRNKIAFTPENAVRDRINAPFASFESIDLEDDIDFSEIDKKYEQPESEPVQESLPEPEPVLVTVPELAEEPEPVKEPESEAEPDNAAVPELEAPVAEEIEEKKNVVEEPAVKELDAEELVVEEPVSEPSVVEETVADEEKDEPVPTVRSPYCENLIREELNRSQRIIKMLKWLLALVVVLLVCVALAFAYHLGKSSTKAPALVLPEKVVILDETEESDSQDVYIDSLGIRRTTPPEEEPVAPEVTSEDENKIPSQEEYNKDARIRTGAYAILGIDTVVTVQEGQTFKGICRAYLGGGMECYVEAVNDGATSVEPDQKIKIPKVKLKKLLKK